MENKCASSSNGIITELTREDGVLLKNEIYKLVQTI